MALKSLHHDPGLCIENTIDLNAVAVKHQHGLQRFYTSAPVSRRQKSPAADRGCVDEMSDASFGKRFPRKSLAGIDLAARRHIRMGQYIIRPDAVPSSNAVAER